MIESQWLVNLKQQALLQDKPRRLIDNTLISRQASVIVRWLSLKVLAKTYQKVLDVKRSHRGNWCLSEQKRMHKGV